MFVLAPTETINEQESIKVSNGINVSPEKSSDDNNLVASSTSVIESKELNNDDRLESVSSPQTKKSISKEIDIDQASGRENYLLSKLITFI